MSNLSTEDQVSDYNNIPVLYCKHCLSIRVRDIPMMENSDFCDKCGSTDIEETSIENWEELYKSRYGHKYLEE
nr:MAG TPA: 40S ribosomal protein S1-A [Crassvirales sp.]